MLMASITPSVFLFGTGLALLAFCFVYKPKQ
jgi:hypothetical protein